MSEKSQTHEPVEHSVWVDCPADEAFRLFTEGFAEWWPLEEHSIHGEDADGCEMEPWPGGRIFERTRGGEEQDWGTIVTWDPPGRLEFTWCPGRTEDRRERVEVTFDTEADGTRVTLIHRGWSQAGGMVCAVRAFARAVQRELVGSY